MDPDEQRRVWVPFHFLPGGRGATLEERLLCVKNSEISRKMIAHHVNMAIDKKPFGMELLGIAAHVYMDTFSHYGFSGIGSQYNAVDGDSLHPIDVKNPDMELYVIEGKLAFFAKYASRSFASFLIEASTNALGHGGVATYPDRPFLHWRVTFDEPRPENGKESDRDNPATFLEGCEKLYGYFREFARGYYTDSQGVEFSNIRATVDRILRFEGDKSDRIRQWKDAIGANAIYQSDEGESEITYNHNDWENEKAGFADLISSETGIGTHVYKFHQAAALHRYYVLKDLLPSHGIAVY